MVDVELNQRPRTEWILLSDYAEVVRGKLYLMGGGWEYLIVPKLPHRRSIGIAVALRVPASDPDKQHAVTIELHGADGTTLATVNARVSVRRATLNPGSTTARVQLAVDVGVEFRVPGTYAVQTRIDGTPDSRIVFNVREGRAQQAQRLGDGQVPVA